MLTSMSLCSAVYRVIVCSLRNITLLVSLLPRNMTIDPINRSYILEMWSRTMKYIHPREKTIIIAIQLYSTAHGLNSIIIFIVHSGYPYKSTTRAIYSLMI